MIWIIASPLLCLGVCLPMFMYWKSAAKYTLAAMYKAAGTLCALIPALVEELVFRGWILGSLRPFGERRALLLSALIFGLMHMNLTQAPFAFMLGLLFGFLYLRTGRLWPGMAVHFLKL